MSQRISPILAALCLAALAPACGEAPEADTPEDQVVESTEQGLSYSWRHGCDGNEKIALQGSERLALFITSPEIVGRYLIHRVGAPKPPWMVDRFFDNDGAWDAATADKIRANFATIHARIKQGDVIAKCRDNARCEGTNAHVIAIAAEKITFCPGFFGNSRAYQAAVWVHELSHELLGTDDSVYGTPPSKLEDEASRKSSYSTVATYVKNNGKTAAERFEAMAINMIGQYFDEECRRIKGRPITKSELDAAIEDIWVGMPPLYSLELKPATPPSCMANGKIGAGPAGSVGEDCGTVAGGPCDAINAGYYASVHGEPEDPEFHPNGNNAWSTRCGDDLESGKAMVCNSTFYPGSGSKYAGTCKICGEPKDGEDPAKYTMLGCAPTGSGCPDGLDEAPDGKCWPINTGAPAWECEADCEDIYNGYGYCVHDASWRAWAHDRFPAFNAYAQSYSKPICAEHTSCVDNGAACASQGKACNPSTGKCVSECNSDADCQAANPPPAYPQDFTCRLATHTCELK